MAIDPLVEKIESLKDPLVQRLEAMKREQKPGLLQQFGQSLFNTAQNIGTVWGPVEAGLNLATQAYGLPASGLAQLAGLPFGKSQQWGQAIQEGTIYQPRTQAGQELTGAISYPFQKLEEAGQGAADWTREATGSPMIAAAIGTGIQASPLLLGLKGKGTAPKLDLKAQMGKQMVEKGFPITKGTLLERIGETVPPGRWWFKKWRAELNDMVNKANSQFVTEELGLPSPLSRMENIKKTRAAWNEVVQVAGKDTRVQAPAVLNWINQNLQDVAISDKKLFSRLSDIKKDLEVGTTSFDKLNSVSSMMWEKWKTLDPKSRRTIGTLREALSGDLQLIENTTGKPVYQAYQRAMESSQMGHQIKGSAFLEKMIKDATQYYPDKEAAIFQPAKFQAIVDQRMPYIEEMFKKNPEVVQGIKDYSAKMMLAARDLAKYAGDKPIPPSELVGTVAGTATILATKTGLIVPLGFETMMAHSLAHPRGWMKRWLFKAD